MRPDRKLTTAGPSFTKAARAPLPADADWAGVGLAATGRAETERVSYGERPSPTPLRATGLLDWLMLVLAVASVVLLAYLYLGDPPPATARLIYIADLVICVIFAVEFVWRWRETGWKRSYPLRNWYEILGMIPALLLAHPALRSFRLLRIIRIVVLLMRISGAIDRALGEEFTYRLVRRFANTVVAAIKRPVTIAVLDEVDAVLRAGHYTRNLVSALEENHTELRAMIVEKVRRDPQTGRLSSLPFHDRIVGSAADATLRVTLDMLNDPRTDELISDILRENLNQIRLAVQSRQISAAEPPPRAESGSEAGPFSPRTPHTTRPDR